MLQPNEVEDVGQDIDIIWRALEIVLIKKFIFSSKKGAKIKDNDEYEQFILSSLAIDLAKMDKHITRAIVNTKNSAYTDIDKYMDISFKDDTKDLIGNVVKSPKDLDRTFLNYSKNNTKDAFIPQLRTLKDNILLSDGNIAQDLSTGYLNQVSKVRDLVVSGTMDIDTAVEQVAGEMSKNGLITYDTNSGRHYKIQDKIRADLKTEVNQNSARVTERLIEMYNIEYVEISSHADSRPTHAVWQGKVLPYKDLASVTGYGTIEGLMGYNCSHSFHPFFKGVSTPAVKEVLPTAQYNGKSYEPYQVTDRQRALERQIRQWKRKVMISEQIGDLDKVYANKQRLKARENVYRDFCKATDRKYRFARTKIYD